MFNWFRRDPEPIRHPLFGKLEWERSKADENHRAVEWWKSRLIFPPTGEGINLSLPGGRKGPKPTEALWEWICDEYTKRRPQLEADMARVCEKAGLVPAKPSIQALWIFDHTIEFGEWKLVCKVADREIHIDGHDSQMYVSEMDIE